MYTRRVSRGRVVIAVVVLAFVSEGRALSQSPSSAETFYGISAGTDLSKLFAGSEVQNFALQASFGRWQESPAVRNGVRMSLFLERSEKDGKPATLGAGFTAALLTDFGSGARGRETATLYGFAGPGFCYLYQAGTAPGAMRLGFSAGLGIARMFHRALFIEMGGFAPIRAPIDWPSTLIASVGVRF